MAVACAVKPNNVLAPLGVAQKPRISYAPQLVSPKQAARMLDERYPGQRPLRQHQVSFLRTVLTLGALRQPTEVHFAQVGQQKFLVNGQHTLTALSQTQRPVWLTVCTLVVSSMAEVDALYRTFDRGLQRNWSDMYRAGRGEDQALLPKQVKLLGAAVPLLAMGFTSFLPGEHYLDAPRKDAVRTAPVRLALMASWEPEALRLFAGLRGAKAVVRLLERAAVLAVALVTYRFQRDQAERFWPVVARDSGLVVGQPAKSLLRFLQETPVRRRAPEEYMRTVAACWNAFYDQRSLEKIRVRAANTPLLLRGTPHDGNADYAYVTALGEVLERPEVVRADVDEACL